MPGIFPDAVNGGIVVRDGAGVCQAPVNVSSAYCPPAGFTSSCPITALPTDCTARISAGQINAIVSEILHFAYALSPAGNWNCTSLANIATAFADWSVKNKVVDGTTIRGAGTQVDPWHISANDIAQALGLGDIATLSRSDFLSLNINQTLSSAQLLRVRASMQMGTAVNYNAGSTANTVLLLDGTGKIPAVDGSLITNVVAAGSLSFATAQTLTSVQKDQLRKNAGAMSGGGYSNLDVSRPSNTSVTITANYIDMFNATGASISKAINATAIITNYGVANGLGSGTFNPTTAYNIFAIYNPTTDVTAALFDNFANGNTPTLPAGFTYWRRVGWCVSEGTPALRVFRQRGNQIWINTNGRVFASGGSGLANFSLAGMVPPTVSRVYGYIQQNNNSVSVADDSNGMLVQCTIPGGGLCYYQFEAGVNNPSSPSLYYSSSSAGGAGVITGWEDNI